MRRAFKRLICLSVAGQRPPDETVQQFLRNAIALDVGADFLRLRPLINLLPRPVLLLIVLAPARVDENRLRRS